MCCAAPPRDVAIELMQLTCRDLALAPLSSTRARALQSVKLRRVSSYSLPWAARVKLSLTLEVPAFVRSTGAAVDILDDEELSALNTSCLLYAVLNAPGLDPAALEQ